MPSRKPRQGGDAPPVLFDRRMMEQQMQAIKSLLAGQEFASADEANAFLDWQLAGGQPVAFAPETPLERAQDLVYQAMEATGGRRQRLARQALAISPDCADAYVLGTRDPQEAKRLYEEGVRAGERALGPATFKNDVGYFWGLLETRPYMRARHGLAEVLWALGEREAAIGHLREMLRLNPDDNQGLRYILTGWLLTTGDEAALDALFKQYPDDGSAAWLYDRALALFRRSGAGRKADAALREALEANPHVPAYLTGAKRLPRRLPAYISFGDESEAVDYGAGGSDPWHATPGAIEWLRSVAAADPAAAPAAPRHRVRRT